MDAFEGNGVFWLAKDPEATVAGRLSYSHDSGASLELLGSFGTPFEWIMSGDNQPTGQRLLGVVSSKLVTLDDCTPTASSLHGPGIEVQQWRAGVALVGHHWEADQPIELDTLTMDFDSLIYWLGRTGITTRYEFESEDGELQRNVATLEPVAEETAKAADRTVISGLGWAVGGDRLTDFHFSQDGYIKVRYDQALGLKAILEDLGPVRDLVALCTDAPAAIRSISGTHAALKHGDSEIPVWVDIMFAASTPLADVPQPVHRMLFTFNQIGGIDTLARWIPLAAKRKPVLGSLLSIKYATSLYGENRFQNVVSAAETLARQRGPNAVMSKADFDKRRKQIVDQAPEGDRQWLKEQLQYANEPRLRDRLANLVEFAGESFTAIVPDTDRWISVVVATRNGMVHHNPKRPVLANAGDLYFLADSVYLLVLLVLLREAGVDAAVLATAKENQRIAFIAGRVEETLARLKPRRS